MSNTHDDEVIDFVVEEFISNKKSKYLRVKCHLLFKREKNLLLDTKD